MLPTLAVLKFAKTYLTMILFKQLLTTVSLAAALLASTATQAQLKLTDSIPKDPNVKIGKLANGLKYYIRQNKKPEQKVELRLVVNAGSILEDDDQQGLAHMSEHMAFNGTKNFKKNDIISFLQTIGVQFGADLNAYTSFDETVYILPIPLDKPANLEKGFQVIEDWAHQVTDLDDDVNGERAVILEESRSGKGADDRMMRKLYPYLFANSKYADRLPIGLDSLIKDFKPDVIRRFYHDWYRPDLMAVIVVGDIDPVKAEELVKKHFANIQNPANERSRIFTAIKPFAKNEALVITDKEATNYSASIAYSAFPEKQSTTVGGYKNDILKNIFTTLLNQRLRELTQKENPPFLYAGVGFGSEARGYDQFGAQTGFANGGANKALAALMEEIERVKRFGFTQPELDRTKQNLMAGMDKQFNEKNKTESSGYAEEYIRNFLTNEPIPGIAVEYGYYQSLLPQITLDDVNNVAKKTQQTPNFLISMTGPVASAGNSLPTSDELLATATTTAARTDITPYQEKTVNTKILDKMPKPGKVIKETNDPILGTKTWILSNGTTVTIKKTDFKNDEIQVAGRRPGGTSNYGVADKFSAQYATTVAATMGYGHFSPVDLQKALAGKTVSATAVLSGTTDGFSGSSTVKDLETMFQLLYLKATEPRIDTGLFKSFVQKSKAQMVFALADPQTSFIDTLMKTVYGNNPLGPIAVPKPEYFDKINMERAIAIYKERFGDASGINFAIVGSIDEAKLKPLVEAYIGGLPSTQKKFNFKDNGVRTIKGKVDLNVFKGQAEKSLILEMYSGEIPYTEDMDLKANAISEVLNIRINEELREKIQGIYSGGMQGNLEKLPYPHYSFFIELPCGPAKVDTLLIAMTAEINKLKNEGPSQANLDKVKQQWLEQNKTSMKENGTWLSEILETKFPGTDVDRFLHYNKYVKALTIKQVQDASKILLNNKNVVTAVLRPEKK